MNDNIPSIPSGGESGPRISPQNPPEVQVDSISVRSAEVVSAQPQPPSAGIVVASIPSSFDLPFSPTSITNLTPPTQKTDTRSSQEPARIEEYKIQPMIGVAVESASNDIEKRVSEQIKKITSALKEKYDIDIDVDDLEFDDTQEIKPKRKIRRIGQEPEQTDAYRGIGEDIQDSELYRGIGSRQAQSETYRPIGATNEQIADNNEGYVSIGQERLLSENYAPMSTDRVASDKYRTIGSDVAEKDSPNDDYTKMGEDRKKSGRYRSMGESGEENAKQNTDEDQRVKDSRWENSETIGEIERRRPTPSRNDDFLGEKELYKCLVLREYDKDGNLVEVGNESTSLPQDHSYKPTWDYVRAVSFEEE
jgi:hypothetical protein